MARVPSVDAGGLDPEFEELLVSTFQTGKRLNLYGAVGNNPELLSGLRAFLRVLWTRSGLTDRQREVVILSVAAEIGSEYEWHQHANIAPDAGVSQAEIAAIASDERTALAPDERPLVAYARAVVAGRVTDEHADAVLERFDAAALVGATAIAATYLGLGRLIDALDVEIETGERFAGWDPR